MSGSQGSCPQPYGEPRGWAWAACCSPSAARQIGAATTHCDCAVFSENQILSLEVVMLYAVSASQVHGRDRDGAPASCSWLALFGSIILQHR